MNGNQSPRRLAAVAGLVLAMFISASPASTTKTTTFVVSLIINSDCQISASALNFGSSGVLQANIAQTTSLTVTCSNATTYNIGLDGGSVAGSTVAARLLGSGGSTIGFQLYSDAGHSVLWGNTLGTNTVAGTGTGSAQTLTVYGLVPPQSTPVPATYSSTVTMSVTF